MEKIRFGIIGCGAIAARFAKALAKSPAAELYACAARELPRAQGFARQYGASRAYGSYQALMEDGQVQAVYIATVHTAHAAAAQDCIREGKPVLCEKPFFTNWQEAQETVRLAREKGVLTMEAFWTRTLPAYQKAKEWMRAGRIGEAGLIQAAMCFPSRPDPAGRLWNPQLGGGALLDVGVYPYQYVTGLMDAPPKGFSSAVLRGITGVDATVHMTLEYPRTIAACTASIAGRLDDAAIISGPEGYIRHPRFYGCRTAELYNNQGQLLESFQDPEEEGFVHEIAHFVELLRQGAQESPLIPLADNVEFARRVDEILGGVSHS